MVSPYSNAVLKEGKSIKLLTQFHFHPTKFSSGVSGGKDTNVYHYQDLQSPLTRSSISQNICKYKLHYEYFIITTHSYLNTFI